MRPHQDRRFENSQNVKVIEGFPSTQNLNLMCITITNLAPAMATLAVHRSLLFAISLARGLLDEHASPINPPKSTTTFSRDKDVSRLRSVGCLAFHRY